jgi:hypothetical protein
MKNLIIHCLGLCLLFSCTSECNDDSCREGQKKEPLRSETVKAQNSDEEVSCKLTTEELRKRKETVLESLKRQILEKKELKDGYAFKFSGTDKTADELVEFIKSERSCCNFFVFTLSFSGDGKETWLSLTGPEGAKDMISQELGL